MCTWNHKHGNDTTRHDSPLLLCSAWFAELCSVKCPETTETLYNIGSPAIHTLSIAHGGTQCGRGVPGRVHICHANQGRRSATTGDCTARPARHECVLRKCQPIDTKHSNRIWDDMHHSIGFYVLPTQWVFGATINIAETNNNSNNYNTIHHHTPYIIPPSSIFTPNIHARNPTGQIEYKLHNKLCTVFNSSMFPPKSTIFKYWESLMCFMQ